MKRIFKLPFRPSPGFPYSNLRGYLGFEKYQATRLWDVASDPREWVRVFIALGGRLPYGDV